MIKRALIVKDPFYTLLLSGQKTWEMRSRRTNIRGRIGLIKSGSGLIGGEIDIVDCLSGKNCNRRMRYQCKAKHCISDMSMLEKWPVAWVMENPEIYKETLPYKHPQGAVVWVKL